MIRTINPDMYQAQKGLSEHVVVVLSYYYRYHVQVGYRKRLFYGTNFYMEKRDRNGYDKRIFESLSPYSWHTYRIQPGYTGQWKIYIDGVHKGSYVTDPPEAAESGALVETVNGVVMIDGTEFRDISYYNAYAGQWYLWNWHHLVENDPYHIIELYDYWFMA